MENQELNGRKIVLVEQEGADLCNKCVFGALRHGANCISYRDADDVIIFACCEDGNKGKVWKYEDLELRKKSEEDQPK